MNFSCGSTFKMVYCCSCVCPGWGWRGCKVARGRGNAQCLLLFWSNVTVWIPDRSPLPTLDSGLVRTVGFSCRKNCKFLQRQWALVGGIFCLPFSCKREGSYFWLRADLSGRDSMAEAGCLISLYAVILGFCAPQGFCHSLAALQHLLSNITVKFWLLLFCVFVWKTWAPGTSS